MSYQQPQPEDSRRPGPSSIDPVTVPDFALVATIRPASAGVPSGTVVPGLVSSDDLVGLLSYVMLMPPPARGPGGEVVRLTAAQVRRLRSTLSYLVSRADALVLTGKGHLVDAAERAWTRGDEVPRRSYVGVTVSTAEQYLAPAVAEEAALNRPPRPGNGSGPRAVIIPEPG